MKQTLLQERFPVYLLEIDHIETGFDSVEAICGYFRACIEAHRSATFIAEFDHYAHTRSLPEGYVSEEIRAARNVVFCFCLSLPSPQALATRPCSIGVAETERGFIVTFMEAPLPVANATMEDWAKGLCDEPIALA